MSFKDISKAKKNTLQLYATLDKYQTYKKASAILPDFYQHDYLFYNDTIQERHARNKEEIAKLLAILRSNTIEPEMLQFNITNTFYPSYVLHHHFTHFLKLTHALAQLNKNLIPLGQKGRKGQALGAVFDNMLNLNFSKNNRVWLENGLIRMTPGSYFYSFKTSPYLHVCCFQIQQKDQNSYVYVQLRNDQLQFASNIEVRDLGATISSDYLCIGYRFHNTKPLFVIQTKPLKLYRSLSDFDATTQLGYSLQDLAKSLYITVRYTNMRVQFATLQKSKKQRPIGQYQAVTSRIADGYATLFGLSFLRQRMIIIPEVGTFMKFYLPFMQQVILQRLIDLRQCCGGHGFLQISGHPALLERVTLRSAQPTSTLVPENKQILKRVHYYSNDDERQTEYLNALTEKGNSNGDILYYFICICIRMRLNKETLNSRFYIKQFIRQSCLQMMYSNTSTQPYDPTNPTQNLLLYNFVKYVLQHAKFLNWKLIKISPERLHELLSERKTQLLLKLAPEIPELTKTMEIGFLRNVILGEQKQQEFYKKIFEASEKNKRNSDEYKDYILKDLKQLIKEQRAKL